MKICETVTEGTMKYQLITKSMNFKPVSLLEDLTKKKKKSAFISEYLFGQLASNFHFVVLRDIQFYSVKK